MLENRLFYLALVIGMLLFHCFYTGWISWMLLLLLLLLPLLSLVLSLPWLIGAKLDTQLPESCLRGDEAAFVIRNRGKGFLPSPLFRFHYICEDVLQGTSQEQRLSLAAWRCTALPLPTAHCGVYRCRLCKGYRYDYLGLFRFPVVLPKEESVFVLPVEREPSPLPNLSQFRCRSYRPKYGGGFSEIHDLRDYHPGDSLRDIHWKLSAKTDRLIVREAQEPDRGQVLLTLDLNGSRSQIDEKLDILCWLSGWLLEHETRHLVRWLDPQGMEPVTVSVGAKEELSQLVLTLLSCTLRPDLPSIEGKRYPAASWRYHIRAAGEEAGDV